MIYGTYFKDNTAGDHGGAIAIHNESFATINKTSFMNNSALHNVGGSILMALSTAVLNNCIFNSNLNTAVILIKNTTALIVNCSFENNSNPLHCGALSVEEFSVVNVSHSTFLNNSRSFSGVMSVNSNSSALINNCSFSANTSVFETHVSHRNKNIEVNGGGGGISVRKSTLRVFQSRFFNNFAFREGGSIFVTNKSSLLIHGADFENNTAGFYGGSISIYNQSFITINESCFTSNSVRHSVEGSLLVAFSVAVLNSCTFNNNLNTAGALVENTTASIVNCTFQSNSNPRHCGHFSKYEFSIANRVYNFDGNSASVIDDCSFYAILLQHVSIFQTITKILQ